jgi:glycosyltransferase involved in cell wall biosynthesis
MQECEAVSIVMCTYNGEKFLIEQIDSIINQTYPIYELIIQDDHSIDNTWDILKSYQQRYHFVKIFQNKRSIGVNENFFSAIKRATGDYIALSDQDDIWEPYKIERKVSGDYQRLAYIINDY